MSEHDDARERSLELIRAAHAFPGPFQVRVVFRPGADMAALDAMRRVTEHDDPIGATTRRSSRTGRFESMAVTLTLLRAEEVLLVYAALKDVDGVVTVL